MLAHLQVAIPLVEFEDDRSRQRIQGWSLLAQEAGKRGSWVITDSYQMAAEMAYYGPGADKTWVWPGTSFRRSQYDLWPSPRFDSGDRVGYVATGIREVPPQLRAQFTRVDGPDLVLRGGHDRWGRVRSVTMFSLSGYLGSLASAPGTPEPVSPETRSPGVRSSQKRQEGF